MEKSDFYVAKNRFGMICLFDAKPHKNRRLGQWRIHRESPYHPWHDTGILRFISEEDLPEGMKLRWSDSHATPVKLSAI